MVSSSYFRRGNLENVLYCAAWIISQRSGGRARGGKQKVKRVVGNHRTQQLSVVAVNTPAVPVDLALLAVKRTANWWDKAYIKGLKTIN